LSRFSLDGSSQWGFYIDLELKQPPLSGFLVKHLEKQAQLGTYFGLAMTKSTKNGETGVALFM